MTDLTQQITEDIKTAMRAGDKARLGVLRMLSAELKQREVVESITLTDAVVIAAIEKMIKQRRDSEQQYRAGDRAELADKEAAEIVVLQHYLPQPLSEAEIAALIDEALRATGAESGRDMGKVIGWLKPKVAGRADMGALSGIIKQRLN